MVSLLSSSAVTKTLNNNIKLHARVYLWPSLLLDFDYGLQFWVPSFGAVLKSSQRVVDYPYDFHATIAKVGISYLEGWYCNWWGSQMVKTFMDFVLCLPA